LVGLNKEVSLELLVKGRNASLDTIGQFEESANGNTRKAHHEYSNKEMSKKVRKNNSFTKRL